MTSGGSELSYSGPINGLFYLDQMWLSRNDLQAKTRGFGRQDTVYQRQTIGAATLLPGNVRMGDSKKLFTKVDRQRHGLKNAIGHSAAAERLSAKLPGSI